MPKEVLTRVGKNRNSQLFYFFRSNDRFGLKYNKPTGRKETINPLETESFMCGNWVPTQSERSAYPFPTECLPIFKKVPTLFPESLYPFLRNSIDP